MSVIPRRVVGAFFNRPLLLTPHAADTISNFLLTRINDDGPQLRRRGGGGEDTAQETTTFFPAQAGADGTFTVHSPQASRFYGETPLSEDGSRRPLPFRRTAEGVAILTLVGEWVNRGGYVGASSGVISYEGFKFQLQSAARDPRTKAILLDIESPGGEAVGAFEAAAAVRAAAALKPVWALVNGLCASAAYAIASGASRIVSIPTGISGSIGVVLAHFDLSEHLKKEGIKPTFIHAGARKVDANQFQALPESVRERLQGEVDDFYRMFVSTVAEGRPGLTAAAIRGTEAGTFMGGEALELGLIDALGSFEDVLAELEAAGGAAPQARVAPAGPAAALPAPSTPAAKAAPIPQEQNVTETEAEGIRAAERARFASILGAPEAVGREAQARELCFSTNLSAETAVAILRAAPPGNAGDAALAASFLAARNAEKPLDLEPDAAGGRPAAPSQAAVTDDIVARLNATLPPNAIIPGRLP